MHDRDKDADLDQLISGSTEYGIEVFLPKIVTEELKGQFQSKIKSSYKKHLASGETLKKLGLNLPAFKPDFEQPVRDFEERILKGFHFTAKILPVPKVTHEEWIQRSYRGLKPFVDSPEGKNRERGLKDYLIFMTIVELLKGGAHHVVYFVTANSRDFCENDELHPDYFELVPQGCQILVFGSMDALIQDKFAANFLSQPDLEKDIWEGKFPGLKKEEICKIISDLFAEKEFHAHEIIVPGTFRDIRIVEFEIPEYLDVEILRLEIGELLIKIFGRNNVKFGAKVDRRIIENGELEYSMWPVETFLDNTPVDPTRSRHFNTYGVGSFCHCYFHLRLIYNQASRRV